MLRVEEEISLPFGQIRNALLPNDGNAGGPGKDRVSAPGKRPGRPPVHAVAGAERREKIRGEDDKSFIDDTTIPTQNYNDTFIEGGFTDRHDFGAAQFDGTLAYRQGIGGPGATPDPSATGPTCRFHMSVLDANLSVPFAVGQQPCAT